MLLVPVRLDEVEALHKAYDAYLEGHTSPNTILRLDWVMGRLDLLERLCIEERNK